MLRKTLQRRQHSSLDQKMSEIVQAGRAAVADTTGQQHTPRNREGTRLGLVCLFPLPGPCFSSELFASPCPHVHPSPLEHSQKKESRSRWFRGQMKDEKHNAQFMTIMAPLASSVSLNLQKATTHKDLFSFRLHLQEVVMQNDLWPLTLGPLQACDTITLPVTSKGDRDGEGNHGWHQEAGKTRLDGYHLQHRLDHKQARR